MKYIEELNNGDSFKVNDVYFMITSDFKNNGQRLGYSLADGSAKWFNPNTIISVEPIYVLDKDNNVIAIKPAQKINDLAN